MTALTSQQRRRVERELLAQRRAAADVAHEELAHATETSFASIAGEVPDFGDQATATTLMDFDNELARRHIEAMTSVEAALARVKRSDFGRCVECGADIGYQRLLASPATTRCVTCQSLHEKTYATGATPTL